jgi:serine/threonine protein kinase
VAATQPVNRAFISALDTTIDAYETARRGLKDRISKGLRDPEVSKRLGLIARDALLSQLDRRRADRGAPRGGDRRKQNHESVVGPAPPLKRFPQRAGREGQFELIELVPGATVTGERHWRLVSRLPAGRQGGHSVVFEAVEVGGSERVVIKFMYLPRAQATDVGDIVRERARRELRNVGKLPSSPFIVPIVDTVVEPAEGAIWLATPLAELGSLASFYRSRPSRSVREVVVVAGQVAAALNLAYTERRLVHRDVKPGNVLVFRIEQRDGHGPVFPVPRIQVTDWGLSRIESLMESALDLSPGGTLWFAAPQAHHAGAADPRDDLFGLGCLIWWLVVGEPPLFAELGPEARSGEIAALVRHRQDTPKPWHDLGVWQPNTPPDLAALVRELMSYDRELRAPAGANPLHWAETQLKLMLDLLDLEAHRTGNEPTVGPAWEAEGVRSALTGNAASLPDGDPFSRTDVDATATDDDASPDAGCAGESGDPVPAGGRDSNFPTDDDSVAEAR